MDEPRVRRGKGVAPRDGCVDENCHARTGLGEYFGSGCNLTQSPEVVLSERVDGPHATGRVAMTKEEFVRDVYEASYRRLVTQLVGPCGDIPTAEEVVQEAFVRAIAQGAAFRRTDNPEAWLRQVAVNLARSRWRRLKKYAGLMPRTGST